MYSIATLILSALLVGSLHADPRNVSCRFLYFGGQDRPEEVFAVSKSAKIPCTLPTLNFSEAVVCQVEENLLTLADGAGKPIASSKVPPDATGALVMVVQTAAAPNPAWRALIISDDNKTFPPGGAFVLNFNPGEIRYIIGEHKGILKPTMKKGYEMPKERDAFNMSPVQFWIDSNGTWKNANESLLRFLPEMRYVFISYTDPLSKRPKLKTINVRG